MLLVPYSLWQFRAESVLANVYHIGVHVTHSDSNFSGNNLRLVAWSSTVNVRACSQLRVLKNAFFLTILEHTIDGSLDLKLSLQSSLDLHDYNMQCSILTETRASL